MAIAVAEGDTYCKQYRLRVAVVGRKSIKVTFPYDVVEREARKRKLTVSQLLKHFSVIAHYGDFDGVYYTFADNKED